MFLTFLLNNKNLVIGLVLIATLAVLYGYIRILKSEKATLVAEKVTIETQLVESQSNLKQLQNDIQSQNAAIDKLKTDADARLAKHQQEVKAAQATANTYKQQAEKLLNRQPAPNISSCDSSNSLINEEIKNAHK